MSCLSRNLSVAARFGGRFLRRNEKIWYHGDVLNGNLWKKQLAVVVDVKTLEEFVSGGAVRRAISSQK